MKRFLIVAIAAISLTLVPQSVEACQPVRTVLKAVVVRSVNVVQGVRYSVRNTVQGVRTGFAQARCN